MKATEERGEKDSASPTKKFAVSSLLPVVALSLSVVSFVLSIRAGQDVARMDVIKTEYGLFHNLAQLQLQYPLMAHLFTVSNQAYETNLKEIVLASSAIEIPQRASMRLQERSTAHYTFTTYEEAFYLWNHVRSGDTARAEQAHEDLDYFNKALCSNPRLLWFWDFRGGKLDREFAGELRAYFQENVKKHGGPGGEKCETPNDAAGPFAQ